MADRYKVVGGSQSGHCCFAATVVDTTKPSFPNDPDPRWADHFAPVCECFERADAERIAAALNVAAGVQEVPRG